MMLTKDDIGRVGRDQYGVRFAVINPRDLGLASPARPEDEHEGPSSVLVLAGSRNRTPGSILHVSWLDFPVEWECQVEADGACTR